ncbi:MAG: ATPase [Gemmatimonadaceae bacterium]
MKSKVVMSWSGGKDSAGALDELLRNDEHEVVALLTSVSEEYRRISHHGVREELLERQADAIGIPLEKVYFPSGGSHPCTHAVYEEIMGTVMARYKARGVEFVAFGDLFLEDLRAYRERNLAKAGMFGLFPIWKRDTSQFARDVIRRGFKSYLTCVEGKIGPGFAGRAFDEDLLKDLPAGTDPCGEHGEFHSFVWDGPIFKSPVAVRAGEIVVRDGRYYADLLPAEADVGRECAAAAMPPV